MVPQPPDFKLWGRGFRNDIAHIALVPVGLPGLHTVSLYEQAGELSDVWSKYVSGGLSWRRGECVI